MEIQYIYVNDIQYLSIEFEYMDRNGTPHCFVVADESLDNVIEENSDADIGIYGYVPVQFLVENLLCSGQEFAQKLHDEYFDMEL